MRSIRLEGPDHRMRLRDAAFLYVERPHAPLTIGCVAVLDSSPSRAELADFIAPRLGRIPRYVQRAKPVPFSLIHPSWENDPDFNLSNHLYRWAIPSPGGDRELTEAVEQLMEKPLDRARPLWEAHLLECLDGGRAAVLLKVHHCMVDGIAGAGILEAMFDEGTPQRARPSTGPTARHQASGLRAESRAMAESFRSSGGAARTLVEMFRHPLEGVSPLRDAAAWALRFVLDGPSQLPWNASVGPRRRVVFTRLALRDALAIRSSLGGTINDVVLTVLAGGLRRYLEGNGITLRGRRVCALVPVNLRTAEQRHALGNRIGAMLVPLPLMPAEETERLAAVCTITQRLKHARKASSCATLFHLADVVPVPLLAWAGSHISLPAFAGVIATNVPGPSEARCLCGRRIEALYPIVPITDHLGLGLSVLSYAGTLCVGFNADAEHVPDLEKLRAGVEESFDQLRARA